MLYRFSSFSIPILHFLANIGRRKELNMATIYTSNPKHIRRKQAAEYLAVWQSYLEKAAVTGNGPPFLRLSPRLVVYDIDDLDVWAASHRVRSTSEPG